MQTSSWFFSEYGIAAAKNQVVQYRKKRRNGEFELKEGVFTA